MFKATRERVGMSQQDVADALGVQVRSVKRWENDTWRYDAPEEAYELLQRRLKTQREMVDYAVSIVEEQAENLGRKPDLIPITYFRNQAMFDQYGRDKGCYSIANANARATAQALEALGYAVEFRYPTEGAIRTPESRY